ncbi:uncharacterized protein LOC126284042 isoform X3 [Schistocerca gregaria]|uniref:uncharacterized protein LOC126284042 isoform X3 n=1 Tax=Schistocerca gregaria TaxID=7010 RepID=UPI00211F3FFD|nr:uncharacterized protein LOC126284042 isoform X3 [Schistocerca gregaria]XP_049838577.1 uncharacterized protein LOC126284042 isoform X3 [Schistocerca gregaria]
MALSYSHENSAYWYPEPGSLNYTVMKRKIEENGESEGPPPKIPGNYSVPLPYGWQPPRVQVNMRGGGMRMARAGPWRGGAVPRGMPAYNPRGYFRGNGRGGRVAPPRYYEVLQQPYPRDYQKPSWLPHYQQHEPLSPQQPPPLPPPPLPPPPQAQQHQAHPPQHQHQHQHQHHHPHPHPHALSSSGTGDTSQIDPNQVEDPNAGNNIVVVRKAVTAPVSVVEETFTKPKSNKRRPMSQSYPSRPWNKEDAERALAVESSHMKGLRNQSLIIRFPDPELTKDMVKAFHPGIENVHFQVPSGPRYCFVQLSESTNADKTMKELEKIKFGSGTLKVEKKFSKDEEELSPEAIDPYTLYIGNLPTKVNIASVKEKFPTASRIDIGFAQRMKFTRYAFIRYNTVDEAIEAYKSTHNLVLDSRSIIVRFRRQRGPVGLPGESRPPKPPKAQKEAAKTQKGKKEKPVKPKEEEEEVEEEEEDDDEDDDDDDEDEDDDDDDDDEDEDDEEEDDDDDDEDEEPDDQDAADDDPDEEDEEDDEEEEEDDEDDSDSSSGA